MRRIFSLFVFALIPCVGCQMSKAMWPDAPANTVHWEKGIFGSSFTATNKANTKIVAKGVNGRKGAPQQVATTQGDAKQTFPFEFGLDELTLETQQDINQREQTNYADKYILQLIEDGNRERIRGDNAERLWAKFNESIPLIGSIVTHGMDARVAMHNKPGLIGELTNLLQQVKSIDPGIVSSVVSNVSGGSAPASAVLPQTPTP